jgi:hypothetical protein
VSPESITTIGNMAAEALAKASGGDPVNTDVSDRAERLRSTGSPYAWG